MLNDLKLCYQAFLDQSSSPKRLTMRQGIDLGKKLVARAPQKNGPAFLESWDEYADRRRAERGQPPIIQW